MNALAMEIRTSSARWMAPVVVAFTTIDLFSGRPWLGVWSDTAQASNNALALMAVLVIAATAWDARRDRKYAHVHNMALAVRSPIYILAVRCIGGCIWWTLAFVSTQAVSGAATWAISPFHGYPWQLAAIGYVAWISYAAFGVVIGRTLPLFAIFPLALIIGYLLTVVLAAFTGRPAAFFSMFDNGLVTVGYTMRERVVVGQIVWFLALSVTCLVIAAFFARFPRPTDIDIAFVGAASLVLIGAFIFLAHIPGERATPVVGASGPRTCSAKGQISICTWSDHAFLQPAIMEVAARAQEAVSSLLVGKISFVESGLSLNSTDVSLYISSNKADGDALASSISSSLIDRLVCGSNASKSVETNEASTDIEQWLWIRSHPQQDQPKATSDNVNKILTLTSSQQQQWVHDIAHNLSCGAS